MDKPFSIVGSICAVLLLCLAAAPATWPDATNPDTDKSTLRKLNSRIVSQFRFFAYDSLQNIARPKDKTAVERHKIACSAWLAVANSSPICTTTVSQSTLSANSGGQHTAGVHVYAGSLNPIQRSKRVHIASRHALGGFMLTAYVLDFHCTGKRPLQPGFGITASGTHAQAGRTIAVDPRVIPIGSKVFIEGIGTRIAEDTGGGVKGKHLDILLPSEDAAVHFGVKRHVQVYLEGIPR